MLATGRPVPEERAVGILLLAVSGNHFLDDDLPGRDYPRRPAEDNGSSAAVSARHALACVA